MLYVFAIAQLVLLVRILQVQAWRVLPVFSMYVVASLVVTLLPRRIADVAWWHSAWVVYAAVLLVGRGLVLAEAVSLTTRGFRGRERRWMLLSVACASATALALLLMLPEGSLFHGFVTVRQHTQTAMFLWAIFTALYLWTRERQDLPVALKQHFALWALFLAVQAAAGILDPRTGIVRVPQTASFWRIVDTGYYLSSALLYLLWASIIRRQNVSQLRTVTSS